MNFETDISKRNLLDLFIKFIEENNFSFEIQIWYHYQNYMH